MSLPLQHHRTHLKRQRCIQRPFQKPYGPSMSTLRKRVSNLQRLHKSPKTGLSFLLKHHTNAPEIGSVFIQRTLQNPTLLPGNPRERLSIPAAFTQESPKTDSLPLQHHTDVSEIAGVYLKISQPDEFTSYNHTNASEIGSRCSQDPPKPYAPFPCTPYANECQSAALYTRSPPYALSPKHHTNALKSAALYTRPQNPPRLLYNPNANSAQVSALNTKDLQTVSFSLYNPKTKASKSAALKPRPSQNNTSFHDNNTERVSNLTLYTKFPNRISSPPLQPARTHLKSAVLLTQTPETLRPHVTPYANECQICSMLTKISQPIKF
ncbi:hypothetical protein HNY73_007391 [Argiope bruennichi]|uniref:Uncharacterized protein n=1 Tax=Argiope bruennichi TaxID=94029 RepID=A0A8T0FDT7_ARGBR|nr:hypothetical protein HNY73_007391 [Argiope bruennichi]